VKTADRVLGVHGFGTPVMGVSLWGLSPLCEIGTFWRAVYQMNASGEQARGEGNCARATERGKEACEWMGKRRVCRLPSAHHSPLGSIFTKSARLRTETSYKAGSVWRVSPTSRSRTLSIDQVKGELAQKKFTLLSGETCTGDLRVVDAPASKACLKVWNKPTQVCLGGAGVSRGRSSEPSIPMTTRRTER
jgi:hypothetical protein